MPIISAKLSSLDPVLFNSVVVAVAVAVALISESNSVTDSVDAKQSRKETMTSSRFRLRLVLFCRERTKERKICLLFLFFHSVVSVRVVVADSSCGVMSVK
ncbi:hypothetical protein CICLE_v10010009mg [Citrus x clementina]|uniref:Uncharacterized protein n=1 Tax=Citrus clementina TaxID=85681 RepID=V4WDW3_CITCL|nr:hypothetical protein CICLE_v10010009mg [Citrus x clementina]